MEPVYVVAIVLGYLFIAGFMWGVLPTHRLMREMEAAYWPLFIVFYLIKRGPQRLGAWVRKRHLKARAL